MRITENFKKVLSGAKGAGYQNIVVIIGGYKATTYCRFHDIDTLIEMPVGIEVDSGRHETPWSGTPNTRSMDSGDIRYTEAFARFRG